MLLSSERWKTPLEQALSRQSGHRVVIDSLRIKVLPPALELDRATLYPTGSSDALLQIDRVRAPLRWSALFRGRVEAQEVILTKPQLAIERAADGSWNLPLLPGASDTANSQGMRPSRWVVKDGTCTFHDAFGPTDERLEATALNGELWPTQKTARVEGRVKSGGLSVGLQFARTPDGQTTLTLSEASSVLKATSQKGKAGESIHVESAVWRWDHAWSVIKFLGRFSGSVSGSVDPVLVRQLSADFETTTSSRCYRLEGAIAKGRIMSKGCLSTESGRHTSLSGNFSLSEVPFAALPEADGFSGRLSGTVTAQSEFRVLISTQAPREVDGTFRIEVREGIYQIPSTPLASIKKAKTLVYMRKKFPALDTEGLAFSKIHLDLKAQGHALRIERAEVHAADWRLRLEGSFDRPRHGMEGWARLDLREKNPALRRLIPGRYIQGSVGHEQIAPMFAHIQGTPAEWTLKAVPANRAPAPLRKK